MSLLSEQQAQDALKRVARKYAVGVAGKDGKDGKDGAAGATGSTGARGDKGDPVHHGLAVLGLRYLMKEGPRRAIAPTPTRRTTR